MFNPLDARQHLPGLARQVSGHVLVVLHSDGFFVDLAWLARLQEWAVGLLVLAAGPLPAQPPDPLRLAPQHLGRGLHLNKQGGLGLLPTCALWVLGVVYSAAQ